MLASACANGTGVPQVLLDAKAAEVQKRAEAQKAIEVRPWEGSSQHCAGHPHWPMRHEAHNFPFSSHRLPGIREQGLQGCRCSVAPCWRSPE